MTNRKELIKQIVKKNQGPDRTFGTDPRDPWSVRNNVSEETINETPLLNRYLKSRGINPEFASKDMKVAHSKTNAFKVWMQAHMNDPVKEETLTTEPSPTRKRSAALGTSTHKHNEIKNPEPGTGKKLHHEEIEQLDELSPETLDSYEKKATDYYRKNLVSKDPEARKKASKRFGGITKSLNRKYRPGGQPIPKGEKATSDWGRPYWGEEVEQVDEVSSELLQRYKDKARTSADTLSAAGKHRKANDRLMNVMKATGKQIQQTTANIKKALRKEESALEAGAANNQPWDGANNPEDVIPAKRSAAKMVKSIVKKHVREDMYDHEKEDKSVAGLKKPKFEKPSVDSVTKQAPEAAAVLKGGKTMTGEKRDTIEIDPMMKMRKQTPDSQKSL